MKSLGNRLFGNDEPKNEIEDDATEGSEEGEGGIGDTHHRGVEIEIFGHAATDAGENLVVRFGKFLVAHNCKYVIVIIVDTIDSARRSAEPACPVHPCSACGR